MISSCGYEPCFQDVQGVGGDAVDREVWPALVVADGDGEAAEVGSHHV